MLESDLAADDSAPTRPRTAGSSSRSSGWQAVEPLVLGPFPPALRALRTCFGSPLLPGGARRRARGRRLDVRDQARARPLRGDRGALDAAARAAAERRLRDRARRPRARGRLGLPARRRAGDRRRARRELPEQAARCTREPGRRVAAGRRRPRRRLPAELRRIAPFPERYDRALGRYRHGPGAFKLDWALDGPIPWRAPECVRAATVHLGGTFEEIAASEWGAWRGRPVERPFLILAQHTLFDPTRAPEGKHTAWAYCHVPNGWAGDMTEAIEAQVERFAPGFRDLVLARHVTTPADFEARNRNFVGGDINGGAFDLGQAWTRPVRALNPYRTPLRGLYLCSAATPPGGGVHGMCGYSAALTALRDGSKRDRRPGSPILDDAERMQDVQVVVPPRPFLSTHVHSGHGVPGPRPVGSVV